MLTTDNHAKEDLGDSAVYEQMGADTKREFTWIELMGLHPNFEISDTIETEISISDISD